jgi:hypothetical protein
MNLEKRQKDMYQGLWFGTILVIILLPIIWLVPAVGGQMELKEKIYLTIFAIIVIPLAWIFFYHQKKIDSKKIKQKENLGEAAFKGVNALHGIELWFGSIRYIFLFIFLIIGGVFILISGGKYWWMGLMLIVIGILIPIVIRTYWKLGRQKLKGRYY